MIWHYLKDDIEYVGHSLGKFFFNVDDPLALTDVSIRSKARV